MQVVSISFPIVSLNPSKAFYIVTFLYLYWNNIRNIVIKAKMLMNARIMIWSLEAVIMMLTIIIYSNLIYLMGNFCCAPSKSNLSNPKKVYHLHLDYYYSMRKKGLRRNRSRRMMLSRRRWSTLMTTPPLLTLAVLIFWRMILQWLRRRNIITMNKHIMIYLWQVLDQFLRIIRAFNCKKKNTKCSRNIRNWTLKRSLRQ
jgi:hypothetical protein